jgi:uncharacterized protein YecT (DUF1311 family)
MNRIVMLVFMFHASAALAVNSCARTNAANAAQCATSEYERLDRQLSARYEQVLRRWSSPEATRQLNDAEEAKSLLIATQRSWKNYRSQQCRTVVAALRTSTPDGAWRSACLSKITKARLAELRELDP